MPRYPKHVEIMDKQWIFQAKADLYAKYKPIFERFIITFHPKVTLCFMLFVRPFLSTTHGKGRENEQGKRIMSRAGKQLTNISLHNALSPVRNSERAMRSEISVEYFPSPDYVVF